jgi:hypothetical protein
MNAIAESLDPAEFVRSYTTDKYGEEIAAWSGATLPEDLIDVLKDLKVPQIAYAEISAALSEAVLPIFEKEHPDDPEPRQAIGIIKSWLKDQTEANVRAAKQLWVFHAANTSSDAAVDDPAGAAAYAAHTVLCHAILSIASPFPALSAQRAAFTASRAGLPNRRAMSLVKEVGHKYFAFLSKG